MNKKVKSINIDVEVWEKFKKIAFKNGRKISSLIEEYMRKEIKKNDL